MVSASYLAKYFRNIFIFCINLDIDEVLLLDKNKGLKINSLELFPLLILEKHFIFCFLSC